MWQRIASLCLLLSISVLCPFVLVLVTSGLPHCWIYLPRPVFLPAPSCLPHFLYWTSRLLYPGPSVKMALLIDWMPDHGSSWLYFIWMFFIPRLRWSMDLFVDPWSGMPWTSWPNMRWHACVFPRAKVWFITGLSTADSDKGPNCFIFQEIWWNLEEALKLHFLNKYLLHTSCPNYLYARPHLTN